MKHKAASRIVEVRAKNIFQKFPKFGYVEQRKIYVGELNKLNYL